MDPDTTARQRFHSFKMGSGAPPPSLARLPHRHSHSRNVSIPSIPLSSSAPSLSPSSPDSPLLIPNASPPKRPASHHRRRSSVSTRHESAELMGVSLPDLPPTHSDDNINLGDRDSIRRRALWALEGKPDMAFSTVEIPDFRSPDTAKPFDFPTKPPFPPNSGVTTFSGKRDSFGKMFTSSSASKDQLGTLVEEEEEDDDKDKDQSHPDSEHPKGPSHPVSNAKSTTRHRPASLNLRPLSLVQGTVVTSVPGNLPTPTNTPGSRPHIRKHVATNDTPSDKGTSVVQTHSSKRFSCASTDSSASFDLDKKRRSSISYKRATDSFPRDMFPPTPEMTPTDRRFSLTSDHDSFVEQPLSIADQHFLFRSHHLLLSRITELERSLKSRISRSRHVSYASDVSTTVSEPSDEMLRLISDLKAERDELKHDVDGWRQRVTDADKQVSMLAKRIESERRDVWITRSRLNILEVEKSALEKTIETNAAALSQSLVDQEALIRERDGMKDEIMKLNIRLKDADATVDECARLRASLEQERTRRKELEKLLDDAGLLNTPKTVHAVNGTWKRATNSASTRPRGLGFQSIDSESSTTDVESVDDSFAKAEFTLDAVAEEEPEYFDEENGLTGYEDEEDSDLSFSSPGGSSIGSADELDIKPKTPTAEIENHPALLTHQSCASLSKTWTFPRGKTGTVIKQDDEVDRFFDCLDDDDKSPPLSQEMSQSAFTSAFLSMSNDEDLPPFVLPSDVGVVVESVSSRTLCITPEDDDELVGEEVEGGIRFTFNAPPLLRVTPPTGACVTPPPEIRITPPAEMTLTALPLAEDDVTIPESVDDEEDGSSLMFGFSPKPKRAERAASPPRSSPPTSQSGSHHSPPSAIPRAISLRSMSSKTPSVTFTPSRNVSGRFTAPMAYTTPPSKKAPSSIPRLGTSPKFHPTPIKVQTSVVTTKPSQASTPNGSTTKPSKLYMINDPLPDLRCASSLQSSSATSEVKPSVSSSSCEYSHAHRASSSLSSIMSYPLAARSPFQKLSNLITFSWTPGATAAIPSSSDSANVEAAATSSLSSTRPAERKFVSKARQLERLRSRFSLEKKNGISPCSMIGCKGCCADDFYL